MSTERELAFTDRMSDHEAMMWNVEKDPWLNPNGAGLILLDRPPDHDHFLQTIRAAVARMPRLYERVVPGLARLSTPAWVPDPEFDLDYHVRWLNLTEPGTERQLFDLAAQLYQEPLDRTRPLWRFVVIEGIEGGRAAIWALMHHSVADGIGQMRMAEMYQQLGPDDPPPADVDLDTIVAAAVEAHDAKEAGGNLATDFADTTAKSVSHLVRRQAGLVRRSAAEMAMWGADPARARHTIDDVLSKVSVAAGIVRGGGEVEGGSPLWKQRSRRRHLEWVRLPLEDLRRAAKDHGATINDVFLAGMADGAVRYHRDRGITVDAFNSSFVVSTRRDRKVGGNAFTPVPVQLSGAEMDPAERIERVSAQLAELRESATSSGGMTSLSGIINLLPTSLVTSVARSQAGKIDFATSNLRGAKFPLYVSGARVLGTVTMGPLAGTACNATAMSYDGNFDIGLFIDPVAIEEPADFRDAVAAAFDTIIAR